MFDHLAESDKQLLLFACAFAISAACGLAWLLRSGDRMTPRSTASAVLNSGLGGLIVSLIWFNTYQHNATFLLGLCALAGIGGVTAIENATQLFHRSIAKYVEMRYDLKDKEDKDG